MACKYAIVIDTSAGMERRSSEICRVLESDGWKANRNQQGRIILTSRKSHHVFRDEPDMRKSLLNFLSRKELAYITIVKV